AATPVGGWPARGRARGGARAGLRAWLARLAAATLLFSGIADAADFDEPFKLPDSQLEPVTWAAIDGWTADDHLAAFNAFQVSCQPFRKIKEPHDERPVYNALWQVCRRAAPGRPAHAQAAPRFFRGNFRPG